MISRRAFVALCADLIKETREKITVRNQLSGYLKYHKEIKAKYLSNLRSYMKKKQKDNSETCLSLQHFLIKKAKIGNCDELANYLAFKLIKRLQLQKIDAEVKITSSATYDHVYVCVRILLKREAFPSIWEIDAWDPRIVDRSKRPDGSIKNEEALKYGAQFRTKYETSTQLFKRKRYRSDEFLDLKPPVEGEDEDRTPTRDIFTKHPKLYSDLTIERAHETKQLGVNGKINYLQKRSSWQKKPKISR